MKGVTHCAVVAVFLLLAVVSVQGSDSVFGGLRRFLPVTQDITVQGSGGGVDCIACTILVSVVGQLAEIHNQTVDDLFSEICDWFPTAIYPTCVYLIDAYGPYIIDGLANNESPDTICADMEMCTNPSCKLFPSTLYSQSPREKKAFKTPKPPTFNPWDFITEILQSVIEHRPLIDFDGDLFSTLDTLRGAYWRGKDCDDWNYGVYPGKQDPGYDAYTDWDCNGISGYDVDGKSFEEKYCSGTGAKGTIIIGDSASAHFHIPVAYFDPRLMDKNTFNHLLSPFAEDEFDWPHRSWGTGHLNDTTGDCGGPLDSIYLRMKQRNLCNHRDYQTLAVNGARSGSVWSANITNSISRSHLTDKPALVFYALIGNDVCFPEHDLNHMTTPQDFEANVLESLNYLDTVLPAGSNVVFVGLANGSLLYEYLHMRKYPLSNQITYKNVYDFLNCLESAPCWVWMSDNATVRDLGTERAYVLSQQYAKIVTKYSFKNFEMAFLEFPVVEVMNLWAKTGGQLWQLIEPLDGFHPNQIFQALEAQVIWDELAKKYPSFLSPVNPNNEAIAAHFGSQGGY